MTGKQVVLLTDFGIRDGSAQVLEAVIARINPNAKVRHLSHLVEPFDVYEGAFLLVANYWHFPPGTIFVAIVDPGVGTERKMLLVETDNYSFLGPDNGILWPTLEAERIEKILVLAGNEVRKNAYAASRDAYFQRPASSVFEGRDYFAPAAALASLLPPGGWNALGQELNEWNLERIRLGLRRKKDNGKIALGQVVYVDSFGNLVIGCTKKEFDGFVGKGEFEISLGKENIRRLSGTYDEGKEGEPMALFGGDFEHPTEGSFLEIALKQDNASLTLGMASSDEIAIIRR
ncbi:MAG: SAM-dependent chlorinase/fluorinase [bacterium]|nr:SAM-dependent chlorinase/fluorinase [bacterium]